MCVYTLIHKIFPQCHIRALMSSFKSFSFTLLTEVSGPSGIGLDSYVPV